MALTESIEYDKIEVVGQYRHVQVRKAHVIKKDGNGLQIKSDSITLDSSGNLTISGTLSSSVGNIGGFTLDSTEIKSNNAKL